jgi:hypothetical protein
MNDLKRKRAFTLVELIVSLVCGIVLILGALIYFGPIHTVGVKITCANNLKQIGWAYHTWTGDNDHLPAQTSVTNGGLKELLVNTNQGPLCWKIFDAMSNSLFYSVGLYEFDLHPRVLLCPKDIRESHPSNRISATILVKNTNISYFAGITGDDMCPQSILAGDRSLAPGTVSSNDFGYSPNTGWGNDVTLSTNPAVSPICWSLKMHSADTTNTAGNLLFGDGSVQLVSSGLLRTSIQPQAGARFVGGSITNAIPSNSFRLLFP